MNKPFRSAKVGLKRIALIAIIIIIICFNQHLTSSGGGGRLSPVSESGKIELLKKEVEYLRIRLEHRIGGVKLSKVAETYCTYFDQWAEYDAFITPPEPSNPWITDSTDFWELDRQT